MDNRKKLCMEFGATHTLDLREVDVTQHIHVADGVGG